MRADLCTDRTGIVLGSKIDEVGECPKRFGDSAGGIRSKDGLVTTGATKSLLVNCPWMMSHFVLAMSMLLRLNGQYEPVEDAPHSPLSKISLLVF